MITLMQNLGRFMSEPPSNKRYKGVCIRCANTRCTFDKGNYLSPIQRVTGRNTPLTTSGLERLLQNIALTDLRDFVITMA